MANIKDYAIIVIYPDGSYEGNTIDNYDCHMQYLILLANNSRRLKEIFKNNNIELSVKSEKAIEPTYSADLKLAQEGIIVLHNMELDDETLSGFYISTPQFINNNQRQSLNRLLDGFDMCDSWFGYLKDGELVDVSFDNFEEIYGKKK